MPWMRHRPTLWRSSSPSPSSPWWRSRFSFGNETLSQSRLERVALHVAFSSSGACTTSTGQWAWWTTESETLPLRPPSFHDRASPPPRALPRSRLPARRVLRPAAPQHEVRLQSLRPLAPHEICLSLQPRANVPLGPLEGSFPTLPHLGAQVRNIPLRLHGVSLYLRGAPPGSGVSEPSAGGDDENGYGDQQGDVLYHQELHVDSPLQHLQGCREVPGGGVEAPMEEHAQ